MQAGPKGRLAAQGVGRNTGLTKHLDRSSDRPPLGVPLLTERQRHSTDVGLLVAVWLAVLVAVVATLLLTL